MIEVSYIHDSDIEDFCKRTETALNDGWSIIKMDFVGDGEDLVCIAVITRTHSEKAYLEYRGAE